MVDFFEESCELCFKIEVQAPFLWGKEVWFGVDGILPICGTVGGGGGRRKRKSDEQAATKEERRLGRQPGTEIHQCLRKFTNILCMVH